jgi:hypothetical protein
LDQYIPEEHNKAVEVELQLVRKLTKAERKKKVARPEDLFIRETLMQQKKQRMDPQTHI